MEQKKMLRIGAVDCEEFSAVCDKEGVTEFPSYRVYPPFPVPPQDYVNIEAELDTDKLKKMSFKHIGNRVIDITSQNHDVFKDDNPGKPKVLLFTDKQKVPIVFRALSTYFDKTLEFGMIKAEEEDLAKKYKVKKFPSFVILKHGEKKPIMYQDDDYSYNALFEFINTYSETFVFKQADDGAVESRASRPWLSEPVPFLSKESGNDICFKKDGVLCVIYAVPTAAESDREVLQAMDYSKEFYSSKIERGITFNFMRLDVSLEPEFASIFNFEEGELPGLVVLNPGKKKRFMKGEYGLTQEGIAQSLDKILGGDARFKMVKGQKMPDLTQEHAIFLQ